MPDKDMSDTVKTLIEQSKAMMEMMKDQSEKNGSPGHSNLAKRPAETQQQSSKIKVINFRMVPSISRLPILLAPVVVGLRKVLVTKAIFQGSPSWDNKIKRSTKFI